MDWVSEIFLRYLYPDHYPVDPCFYYLYPDLEFPSKNCNIRRISDPSQADSKLKICFVITQCGKWKNIKIIIFYFQIKQKHKK